MYIVVRRFIIQRAEFHELWVFELSDLVILSLFSIVYTADCDVFRVGPYNSYLTICNIKLL